MARRQAGVRCEHAVVAVAVNSGRRGQVREGLEELDGREREHGSAVGGSPRQAVENPPHLGAGASVIGENGCAQAFDREAFECEGWACAVADQLFAAARSRPSTRTAALMLKPPAACHVSMSAAT